MIHSETTVREVALQIPQSTRLFEKLKIDYCCGGNQPLAEACTSAGVDLDSLMERLGKMTQSNSQDASARIFNTLPSPN